MSSSATMRAMAVPSFGSIDRVAMIDVPRPTPGPGEVRVALRAAAINPADVKVIEGRGRVLHAKVFPLIVGYDLAGVVDAVGPGVGELAVGDEVFGFVPYAMSSRRGTFAEAVCVAAAHVARKPAAVSFAQAAAAATPGLTALQALRDVGRLRAGQRALVTGVSGGVGSLGVAVAHRLGAEVTAVGSGAGLAVARTLGATHVADRAGDLRAQAPGPYDVVFDAAAAFAWRTWRDRLAPGGTFVTTLPSGTFVVDKLRTLASSTRCKMVMVKARTADLTQLGTWLADGLTVPVDRELPLAQLADGLAVMARGARGRLVVAIA